MGKIKLNLTSGAIVEKPLITAFKGSNANYVVLDNEMNGSMGLPIILVCKLENNKLVKINDQNEWTMVKENLKSIIAGGNIEYINVSDTINADDIYYTQLTLPLPSYDSLKNNYKPVNTNNIINDTASIFDINPPLNETNMNSNVNNLVNNVNAPVSNATVENGTPIQNITPTMNPNPETVNPFQNNSNINQVNNINPTSPVIDIPMGNSSNLASSEPTVSTNTVTDAATPISPVVDMNTSSIEVSPSIQHIEPNVPTEQSTSTPEAPIDNNQSTLIVNESIFKEQKEAFMQACENMFDALVQKFEKELEKNK